MRAILYLRLSSLSDDSTSIARQLSDLRALADREGWAVVRELTDDGLTGRKSRHNAAEALRMLREGDADVLAVWKFDRWSRQGLPAVADLITTLDDQPSAQFYALADGLNSSLPAWRIIAAVLAEVARVEAENTAARVTSSIAHRRRVTHRYTGGSTIPFGYRSAPAPDGIGRVLVIEPSEAAIVREVAERLLDRGESQTAIARDLTARGIPTSRSPRRRAAYLGRPDDTLDAGYWRTHTVRDLWRSETLLGRVTHRGEPVRDADGVPLAVWPPILDPGTLERLRARLDPIPRTAPQRTRQARLLSSVAYCAYCDNKLYVTTSGGHAIYKCATPRESGRCTFQVTVNADALDAYVTESFLSIIGGSPEVREVETVTSPETAAELADVETALRTASGALMEDDVDATAIVARIASLKERRTALRSVPTSIVRTIQPTGRTFAEAWHASDGVDSHRTQLTQALDHLTVSAATSNRRGARFDGGDRVTFYWHPADGYSARPDAAV